MINYGKISYKEAESSGNIIASLAKYFLLIVSACVVVAGIIIASKKHVKLNTKIKKDEKLKFVDMLTSLKNRNYLNERISVWNQNTIYPQAIIVIDLNNIKYLNDTFGHEEGDTQIKAAANVLHQTQPDNSEIMRTDGNEFMVYLVGYNEKQVVNYLKKLVKEFNNLPYEYGAAFGFSMIVDDLKLLDDAINEATLKMRENKEIEARDEEKES
jgi:diguanylate cyclase (GGDEF)-like protein